MHVRRRHLATTTALAALMVLPAAAWAGPQGGTVVNGAAAISQAGSVTTINQSSGKAIINWQGFSVAPTETVNFNQPSASAATLNRVIGNEASVIQGALNANGQVFIVNSAGVLFGKNAQVNVGGLVASTLDISNENFLAGNYTFSGSSSASVVNQGRIRTSLGGYVALLGKTVSNEGVISARLGTVAMSSGEKITLNFEGDSLVDVTIDRGTLNALVENKGLVKADGGQVIMTAKAADAVLSAQVNNTGIVQARTMAALKGSSGTQTAKKGSIKLYAYGGTTTVSGKLDASAPKGGDGGTIETSGDHVKIADSAVVTTKAANGTSGTWLIDPTDFTIAASGGDMTGTLLGSMLDHNGNVIITAATMGASGVNGDINVNDAVTWSSDGVLTLNAVRDIVINRNITATGTNAGLVLNYGGYNGTTVTTPTSGTDYIIPAGVSVSLAHSGLSTVNGAGLTINGNAYTLIQSMSQLDLLDGVDSTTSTAAGSTLAGYYALGRDLYATSDGTATGTATTYLTSLINNLTGTLAGLGHTVTGLTIRPSSSASTTPLGLVGTLGAAGLNTATVRDVGVVNATVDASMNYSSAAMYVGTLVGRVYGVVSNTYATGTVTSTGTAARTGGLVGGILSGGRVSGSYAAAAVSGYSLVGGLAGYVNAGTISNSYATGAVSGNGAAAGQASQNIGGLAGEIIGGSTVSNSYATGDVTATGIVIGATLSLGNYIGGLVGQSSSSTITDSHATGNVTTRDSEYVGGLVGLNGAVGTTAGTNTSAIINSYATGDVTASFTTNPPTPGNVYVGGLAGSSNSTGSIINSRAAGNVTVTAAAGVVVNDVGGLIGFNYSNVVNSSATGSVRGNGAVSDVGGLVGTNAGTITGSSYSNSTAGVSTDGSVVGGVVGYNSGTVTGSSSDTAVWGVGNVGGFVGGNDGSISNSVAYGSVTGYGAIGGFAGANGGTLDSVVAYADVTSLGAMSNGYVAVGALVGDNRNIGNYHGKIYNSYGYGSGADGLTGLNSGTVTNSTYRDLKAEARQAAAEAAARQAAAEAAARQAAAEAAALRAAIDAAGRTGSVIATVGVSESAATPTGAAVSAAGAAAVEGASPTVEDHITIDGTTPARQTQTREQRPGRGAAAASARRRGGAGGGYGATIRSIEVDGQRFDLQDDGARRGAPSQNTR